MSYSCFLGGIEFPVPSKLTIKVKNKNKTLVLLNEGEINFLRDPGLTEIEVPFVFRMHADIAPDYYLGILEQMKTKKLHVPFILARQTNNGRSLFDTNIQVSCEEYNITENGKNGLDVSVTVQLKQWRDYGTKTVTVQTGSASTQKTVSVQKERDASTAPQAKTHTVKAGDTLWAIAVRYYGSGAQYTKIYNANKDKISNPNLIYPGQVLTIP